MSLSQNHRGAFDLVELALWFVSALVLVVGTLAIFSLAYNNSSVTESERETMAVYALIEGQLAAQSSYSQITTETLIGTGQLPQSWVLNSNGTEEIELPGGATMTISPAPTN